MNALIYDLEIIKAVHDRKAAREPGIDYCAGWEDHANMGVSVIGCWDIQEQRMRVFCADNFVGFNSIPFDNAVLRTIGIDLPEPKCYDLLREIWAAEGLGPKFVYPTHAGYGLDAVCKANGFGGKTGYGGTAPVLWQQGKIGAVIDYCLQDINLTRTVFKEAISNGIKSPVTGKTIVLRSPDKKGD
jgi:hypothetical protein